MHGVITYYRVINAGLYTGPQEIDALLDVAQVSGHSVRVGATQDLLALNMDLASIMQAGR
jgi:hypothetical protein